MPLKANVDAAAERAPALETVIVVKATGGDVAMGDGRDVWYHEAAATVVAPTARPSRWRAEDPLFILYTSGSTGKPKGVLHTTGGYLLWASLTHELVFDYRPGQIYWCAADIGWVTGHSYIVYGPLANGATTLMFEGVPNWPDASRIWQVVDRHQVDRSLHRADRAARADAGGRRLRHATSRAVAQAARHGRRADQSRGVALVSRRRRRGPLPDRRHLVADRDRRRT